MLLHPRQTTHARSFVTVLLVFFVVTGSLVSFVHVASEPVAAHDGTHDTPLGTGGLGSTDSSDFTTETVVDGLVQPISLTFLPDGRMLVLEKGGRIVITDPGDASLDSQTYMTLTNIDTTGERGLISITLDPQFLQNGYFYLYYQPATPAQSRVARFQHVENSGGLSSRGDLSSETVIWENPDTYVGEYHFGGGFEFGPDGLLYLTTGEEFDPSLSQDLSSAGGKIHRFYPNGTVPADNPFLDNASAIDTIWAYGLRNPYRAKWDLSTHRFFVGDVGGNVADSREEVNLGEAGANYAWPICEGDCVGSEYTDPLYSYPHRTVGGSIISGPVYRGNQYPSEYTGAYFFSDYAYNEIRYLTFDDTGAVTGDYLFRNFAGRPVDLVEGPDGALYSPLIAYGNVKRVEYKFATDAPYITGVSANVTEGAAPLAVEFTGLAEDPNGEELTFTWTFGDGNTATGSTVTHTYASTGVYQARLTVTDASGNQDISDPIEITVGSGPVVQIDSPADGSTFVAGDTISFSGSATTPAGDPVPPEDLSWTVLFTHNDHTHPVLGPVSGSSGSFDIARTGHDYHSDTGYRISLTATDTSTGVSSTQSVDIDPEKVDLTIDTSPDGVDVSIDGIPDTTPYVYDTLIGFDHTLTAPASQCVAGTTYEFDSWSDGGARSHVVRVPTTDTTYTATYVASGPCTSSGIPTDGLVAQYESTQGLSASGGTVTGWSDASGNGNDLTAVGDPQVTSDAPNGEQVVAFDGAGDALVRTGLTGFPSGDADRTVVALVRYDSAGFGGVGYGSPALNQLFGLSVNPDGEMMVQGWGRSNDFHTTTVGTGAGWLTQAAVHENGAFTHYKDGVAIDSASHTFGTTTDRIVMGAEIDEDPYVDMDVAAVFVYDRALTETERQQVEAYLQQQYVTTTTGDTAPVASDDSASVAQGGSVTVDVLANDADADGDIDPSSVRITEYPVSGDVSVDSTTGEVTYDHDGSSSTSDSFRYTVADATANVSNEAIVSVLISGSPPPSDLPVTSGLALHLDSTTGVTTSGGAVTTWADQSGNGNDLTASGGPTVVTSPTGAQVIRFDGVDDIASRTSGVSGLPTENADRTVFLVADYQGTGFGGAGYGSPALNQLFGLSVHPDGRLSLQGWGRSNDFHSNTMGTGAGWLVQSAVHGSGAFTHYKDGTVIDSATHTYATSSEKIVVGAEIDENPYVDMDVGAVIVYDRALSDTERQQVEDYLRQRYIEAAQGTASVSISSPSEGETITGESLTVSWAATAANQNDHVHVTLDDQPYVGSQPLSGSYTFTGLAPGDHRVTVQVASQEHVLYTNPEARDVVNVTLEAATSDTAPIATDDSASVSQGGSVTVDVLANDADADGDIDPTTVQVTSYPASGTLVVDAVTGAIEYTHDGSATTSDSFAYTVADSTGNVSNEATVSVSISGSTPPSDLPVTSGLALHLDSTTGVTTSGGAVTTWADQSGNGNDLSASGGPTLATSPTGAQVVRFDGVDDVATRTSGISGLPTGNADRTVFVVAEYRSTGFGGAGYGSPALNQLFGLSVHPDGRLSLQGWGRSNDFHSNTVGTGAGWLVQSAVHESGAFTHYKDGVAIDSASHTYATSSGKIVVGAEIDEAPYIDMDVATMIVYDRALTDTERQQVEDYLRQRYIDAAQSTASVTITSPSEGATISGSDLSVSWDATGATTDDHVHLSLDGGPVVDDRPLSGSYTFTGVSPGSHTVIATVADSSHAEYTNGGATDSVTVTLESTTTTGSAPVASDDSASVVQGGSVTVDVLANDNDADGDIDPTTVQVTSSPASGTTTVDATTGAIEYTNAGTTTSDSFRYTVADATGNVSNEAVVSVSISEPVSTDLPVTDGVALHLTGEAGLSTSGGVVTGWADQSGNGNDLTASGGPTVATGVANGYDAVRFDGVDDVATRTSGVSGLPTGNADRTVFVVAEYRSTGFGGAGYGSPALNQLFGLSVHPDGRLSLQGWGRSNDFHSNTVGTGAGWLVQSAVHESGVFTHYKDGVAIDSASHTYATSSEKIVVGAEIDENPYLDMDVATVIVYDRALSATERQQVESYLQQRYLGVTQTAPTISVTAPTDGATVSGSDLSVSWDTSGTTTDDHVHLSLDGGPVVDDRPLSGTYTFTGVAAGSHTVTAQVADSGHVAYTNPGATDSVTVTLEAATTNSPPVATDDSASVAQGESVTVDVLANDDDPDGSLDPTTVQVTSYPASGTLVVDAVTGAIEYTHDGSATTSDSFAYTVDDDAGATSNEATVSVSISSSPPPSDLPVASGLALHLDSTTGVTTSGGAVTTWADQSGNGNDLTTSGGPTVATSPTGAQVVRFDGVDDVASRTGGLTGVPTGSADRTMFVVAEYREVGYGGIVYGSPSMNDAFGLSVGPDGNLMVQGWGGPNDYISTTAGTGAGWLTQSVVYENGAFTHYKDGTSIDSATHGFTTTADRIVVGAEMTPAPYLDMDVAAVVIYDRALSATERQQVEAYLQQTYVGSGGSTPTASVSITDPTAGATITGSDLSVSWDGTAAQSGDHVHLSLDGGPVVDDRPLSGTYTFTGVAAGSHTVTATVADSGHTAYTNPEATDSVTVTLEPTTTSSAPVASDDSASVMRGGSATVDVLANDDDADGDIDPTTVQVTSYPASGTVVVDAVTGAIEYTHDESATTSDSFRYTVTDATGNVSNEAVVSVSITPAPSGDLPITDGLALHLDSTTGITTSGGAVTTWADQSGNGNDLSASGGPTLATSPTGVQVVRFDGVDDVATRTSGISGLPTGNADRTVFVVAEYRSTGFGGVGYGSPALNQLFGLSVHPDGRLSLQGWGRSNDFHSNTMGTGAGWLIQSAVHESGAFTHYKDGTVIDSATHTYATSSEKIVVGAEIDENPYLDMDVAAVIIYDRALTETERQQVEDYLRQRYLG